MGGEEAAGFWQIDTDHQIAQLGYDERHGVTQYHCTAWDRYRLRSPETYALQASGLYGTAFGLQRNCYRADVNGLITVIISQSKSGAFPTNATMNHQP